MVRISCAIAVVIAAMAIDWRPVLAREGAPWCAMLNVGTGEVYWDCQYETFEDCYPHLFEGNRGFCNLNPAYHGPVPRMVRHHPRRHVRQ